MKLSFEDIKSITVGAVRVWQEEGVTRFSKMTEGQLAAFKALSDALFGTASATTGIRLDFVTNSTAFTFVPADAGKYEIKIDGVLRERIEAEAGKEYTFAIGNGKEEHRVFLSLPSHDSHGGIISVSLDDGATLRRANFDTKMLFIGDSITQGWNSHFDTLSYAYQVSDYFNADSIIQGVGGAFFDKTTLEKLDFDPDTVIFAYGTNDSFRIKTLDEFGELVHYCLAKVKEFYPRAKMYVITPIWRTDFDEPKHYGHIKLVGERIEEEAKKLELSVIDGLSLIPPFEKFMADSIHPNDLGFSVYAHNLIKALEK